MNVVEKVMDLILFSRNAIHEYGGLSMPAMAAKNPLVMFFSSLFDEFTIPDALWIIFCAIF